MDEFYITPTPNQNAKIYSKDEVEALSVFGKLSSDCGPPWTCGGTGGWCDCECYCCPPCPCYTFTFTACIECGTKENDNFKEADGACPEECCGPTSTPNTPTPNTPTPNTPTPNTPTPTPNTPTPNTPTPNTPTPNTPTPNTPTPTPNTPTPNTPTPNTPTPTPTVTECSDCKRWCEECIKPPGAINVPQCLCGGTKRGTWVPDSTRPDGGYCNCHGSIVSNIQENYLIKNNETNNFYEFLEHPLPTPTPDIEIKEKEIKTKDNYEFMQGIGELDVPFPNFDYSLEEDFEFDEELNEFVDEEGNIVHALSTACSVPCSSTTIGISFSGCCVLNPAGGGTTVSFFAVKGGTVSISGAGEFGCMVIKPYINGVETDSLTVKECTAVTASVSLEPKDPDDPCCTCCTVGYLTTSLIPECAGTAMIQKLDVSTGEKKLFLKKKYIESLALKNKKIQLKNKEAKD